MEENENPTSELEVGEAFDDNGYVRVFLPKDGEGVGHIMTTYRKTALQKISYLISLISVVAVAFTAALTKLFGKHQRAK